jgi:hypothetical protein
MAPAAGDGPRPQANTPQEHAPTETTQASPRLQFFTPALVRETRVRIDLGDVTRHNIFRDRPDLAFPAIEEFIGHIKDSERAD